MDTLLSVDLGTTGCKAVVCWLEGQLLGISNIEYPLIHISPQFVEQDANLWWSLSRQVIREAVEAEEVDGCSSQRSIGVEQIYYCSPEHGSNYGCGSSGYREPAKESTQFSPGNQLG